MMAKTSINQEIGLLLQNVMVHVFVVQGGTWLVSVCVHLKILNVKWVKRKLNFHVQLPTVVVRVQHGNV